MIKLRSLLLLAGACVSLGATSPTEQTGVGYVPKDQEERGIWMQAEEYERNLKHSTFVMRDPALNAYVRDVFCRTVGQAECKDVRIYLVRTPEFNASMYPNGLMQVYSGLLLRSRNEAQMAAILGHEYTHYSNRHSLQFQRDAKKKLGALAFLSVLDGGLLTGTLLVGGLFQNSREMEAEADAGSIPMLVRAGYNPRAASLVWEQLRAEMDATALARGKKSRKDKDGGLFASHPPTAERVTVLKALAEKVTLPAPPNDRRSEYRTALASFWADFVDDQIKLNDFGATEFLLSSLASEGWTSELHYARGELYRSRGRPEDLPKAAGFYRQAIALGAAPPEAWRGLGLALLRSGTAEEGKAALKDYLVKKPGASDRAMMNMLAGG
jgi:beta-barrel assembly-enhancing protease